VPGVLSVFGFVLRIELRIFTTIGVARARPCDRRPAVDPHSAVALAGRAAALVGGGLWLRREARFFRARWDALIEDAKAQGRACMSAGHRAARRRQELRPHRDHPRRRPRHPARRAPRHDRPNGAGKTTLFNLISGRFP
jgi:hypothetical protein